MDGGIKRSDLFEVFNSDRDDSRFTKVATYMGAESGAQSAFE